MTQYKSSTSPPNPVINQTAQFAASNMHNTQSMSHSRVNSKDLSVALASKPKISAVDQNKKPMFHEQWTLSLFNHKVC